MEGLAASILLMAIMLGVLLTVGGLVYLLARHLRERPVKPVDRRLGIGGIILVLLVRSPGHAAAGRSMPQ
jgi:hypothetical protein